MCILLYVINIELSIWMQCAFTSSDATESYTMGLSEMTCLHNPSVEITYMIKTKKNQLASLSNFITLVVCSAPCQKTCLSHLLLSCYRSLSFPPPPTMSSLCLLTAMNVTKNSEPSSGRGVKVGQRSVVS